MQLTKMQQMCKLSEPGGVFSACHPRISFLTPKGPLLLDTPLLFLNYSIEGSNKAVGYQVVGVH